MVYSVFAMNQNKIVFINNNIDYIFTITSVHKVGQTNVLKTESHTIPNHILFAFILGLDSDLTIPCKILTNSQKQCQTNLY